MGASKSKSAEISKELNVNDTQRNYPKSAEKYVRVKGKSERSLFLSFFCGQTGIKHKYVQKPQSGKRDGRVKGRHKRQAVRAITLRGILRASERSARKSSQPCSHRLKTTLKMWIKSYSKRVRGMSQISASQMDRVLKCFRIELPRTKSWLRVRSVESAR